MQNFSDAFQKKMQFTIDAAVFASHFPNQKLGVGTQRKQGR